MAKIFERLRTLRKAPMFSPTGFLVRAAMLILLFTLCHFAGLREYTSFLSGTLPAAKVKIFFGCAYLVFYLGAVGLAPVFVLASGIFWVLQKKLAPAKQADS